MKCVIIDDEPLAIDVIASYLQKIEGMEIIAKCSNPLDALLILNSNKVDLVFLDIEMPNLTGIDLVKALDTIPQFIFTTAYPEYAIEGFNLNATDYLIKPIPLHRFIKAVSRAKEKHALSKVTVSQTPNVTANSSISSQDQFIFVRSEYENIKINLDDIKYIQGLKDYLKIHVKYTNKPILTLSNFKEIMNRLPTNQFLRVHRSFIVSIPHIKALQKTKIVIDDVRIPIGETYKKTVFQRLGI